MPSRKLSFALLACLVLAAASAGATQESPPEPPEVTEPVASVSPQVVEPAEYLLLPRVGNYRRAALHTDPIEAAIARGDWSEPNPGDEVLAPSGQTRAWFALSDPGEANKQPMRGGYAYARFESPAQAVMLLDAPGVAAACLNGDWIAGDPYSLGWFRPPVEIKQGENWVLLHLADPAARVRFVAPVSPVRLLSGQATLPDLIEGDPSSIALSVPIVNASTEPLESCRVRLRLADKEPITIPLRRIDPLLITPITLQSPPPEEFKRGEPVSLKIEVLGEQGDGGQESMILAEAELELNTVSNNDPHRRTFISQIDRSVQAYEVRPAVGGESTISKPGALLALHDAGESAARCADAYGQLNGLHVIAPGGRGLWGFDWEDWSARDAIEALDDFQSRANTTGPAFDPRRVTVTGRGMGGHGALWLGVLFPDRFAAVAPRDAWISLSTQGGDAISQRSPEAIAAVLSRQTRARDPLRLLGNLAGTGVYIMHDGDSSAVSAADSRMLRRRLGESHRDFAYYEALADGARDPLPAAWEPLLGFARSRLSAEPTTPSAQPDRIDFTSPDLGVVSRRGWLEMTAVNKPARSARVSALRNSKTGELTISTENVRRLKISLGGVRSARIDGGKKVALPPDEPEHRLSRDPKGVWRRLPSISPGQLNARLARYKSSTRPGGFKSAFDNRPILMYGTRGEEPARRWAAAKARYDAHLFLYRGAGLLEVAPDTTYARIYSGSSHRDRSIVLYGNQDTNSACRSLLALSWAEPRAESIGLGLRPESGDDLGLLLLAPRPRSRFASVALIGGTGAAGMRATSRLRYFWSGVSYPDLLLFGPGVLSPQAGEAPESDVRAAGYFDYDWSLESGEVVWRDLAI